MTSAESRPGPRRAFLASAVLAAASALAWWAAFPPLGLWPAGFAALTPLLVLAAPAGGWAAAGWSLAAGWTANALCILWLRHVTWAGMFCLSFYMAIYWTAAVALIRWVRGRAGWPLVLIAPPIWVSLEWFRGWFLTGFPWVFLGHSQFPNRALIQVMDVTGAAGVSFLLAAAAAVLADGWLGRFRRPWPTWAVVVAALLAVSYAYGGLRLSQSLPLPGPRVLLVQGNIPQSLKHTGTPPAAADILRRHLDLSLAETRPVDLIVWAETMMPVALNVILERPEVLDRLGEVWKAALRGVRDMAGRGCHLLIGAPGFDLDTRRQYNSVCFISPEGRLLGRYDKIRLVLFGEFVPLKDVFPFLRCFRPPEMGDDLSPGRERKQFSLPWGDGRRARLGVTVCYEDAEAGLARAFARDGVAVMVNVTNDGWFLDSAELDMHLAMSGLRAVETRRPWVRATNNGISAVLDAAGRVTVRLVRDGRDRNVAGALRAEVPLSGLTSLYVRIGDAFAWLMAVAGGCLVALAARRGRAQAVAEGPSRPPRRRRS